MTLPRAQPLYFGPTDRPCFGWLHGAPADAGAPRLGLVVCNPFGYESISAYRTLRHFAESAAAAGIPSLRFDYDGTGDSAGDDRDAGRCDAWIASIHHAVETLKGASGVQRVCLLGLRLGATLAALAASQRDDVAGLVAVVPVLHGRAWLRELKILESATGFAPPPPDYAATGGDQEALGYLLTAETQAAIARLDLVALDRRPAADVLVLDRDDLPPDPRFVERLRGLGARVEQRRVPGYVRMMLDAHDSVVPAEMLPETVAWLGQRLAGAPAAGESSGLTTNGGPVAVAPGVTEQPVFLDQTRTLFGILSMPAGGGAPTRGILLLNSGAIPHSGPNRQYVRLARRWAARGCAVLRLDVAGIGDSLPWPAEPENVVYSPHAVTDVGAAADWLCGRLGDAPLNAVGLCSGAYHGFKAAVAGTRLDRVVIVNPLVFFWKPGMSLAYPTYQVSTATARYKRSVWQLDKWKKLFSGKVDVAAVAQVVVRRSALQAGRLGRDLARIVGLPMKDDLGGELETVARRGVALQFVFSSGDPGEDLLRLGAGWTLRRLLGDGRVAIQRIVGPNHAFTPLWSQEALTAAIETALDVR